MPCPGRTPPFSATPRSAPTHSPYSAAASAKARSVVGSVQRRQNGRFSCSLRAGAPCAAGHWWPCCWRPRQRRSSRLVGAAPCLCKPSAAPPWTGSPPVRMWREQPVPTCSSCAGDASRETAEVGMLLCHGLRQITSFASVSERPGRHAARSFHLSNITDRGQGTALESSACNMAHSSTAVLQRREYSFRSQSGESDLNLVD